MIKTKIINPELLYELALLGHFDKVMICDIGYPIPADANRLDLSLVPGLPSMPQVLEALLSSCVFQGYTIVEDMKDIVPDVYQYVTTTLSKLPHDEVSWEELQAKAADCKLYIRSGENRRKCNVILTSTSAAPNLVEQYDIEL